MKNESGIYRLVFPNGKTYIGQTTVSFKERWYRHKCSGRKNAEGKKNSYPVSSAIRKYGWGNIKKEVLVIANDHEYLNLIETRIIKKFKTLIGENGYNVSFGGGSFEHRINDISGQKFGELTAIEISHRTSHVFWKCTCSCGREKIASYGHLVAGDCKTCGDKSHFREDLIGQKFGELTVDSFSHTGPSSAGATCNSNIWKCTCSCGREKIASTSELKSGNVKSCGAKIHKIKDLTGLKFGGVTVIALDEIATSRARSCQSQWKCKCLCGKIFIADGYKLSTLHTKSCGCLNRRGVTMTIDGIKYESMASAALDKRVSVSCISYRLKSKKLPRVYKGLMIQLQSRRLNGRRGIHNYT